MFERMSRGWTMMKQSWQVLRSDKSLILFPILSSIACCLIMVSFALPLVASPQLRGAIFSSMQDDESKQPAADQNPVGKQFELNSQKIIPAIYGIAFYLCTSFVVV